MSQALRVPYHVARHVGASIPRSVYYQPVRASVRFPRPALDTEVVAARRVEKPGASALRLMKSAPRKTLRRRRTLDYIHPSL